MDTLADVCRTDPDLLLATSYTLVDVTDPASVAFESEPVDPRL